MIDANVLRIAEDRIRLEFEHQNQTASREIEALKAQMAGRGVLHSGMMVMETAAICARSAEARGELAWRIMHRTITAAGIKHSETLADELKRALDKYLGTADLASQLDDVLRLTNVQNPNVRDGAQHELRGGESRARRRADNEIDLFVASLKAEEANSAAGHTTIHAYAPVGTIQTGPGATAVVTQNIDTGARTAIEEALEQLVRELEKATTLSVPKGEVIEVVREAKAEIARPEPNRTRLRSLLATTGEVVRTVASLRPAYEQLKTALAVIGLDLP